MKAQDHYRALVESSDDAIIAKDLGSIVVSWNPAAERLFGFTAEEMVGQSIRRLIPDDRQKEEDDILATIVKGERSSRFTTERLHKDGSLVRVLREWTHTHEGFYLYSPSREHMPTKVRALLDFLIEKRDRMTLL